MTTLAKMIVDARRAVALAADYARPVRGRDEVALRTRDWHAIMRLVGEIDHTPQDAVDDLAAALARAEKAEAALAGVRNAALEEAAALIDAEREEARKLQHEAPHPALLVQLTCRDLAKTIRAARTVEPRHD